MSHFETVDDLRVSRDLPAVVLPPTFHPIKSAHTTKANGRNTLSFLTPKFVFGILDLCPDL